MKQKIDVADLKVGMYVFELDRPWLETSFLFQGFPLKNQDDIEALRRCCSYVYIDTERASDGAGVQRHPGSPWTGAEPDTGRRRGSAGYPLSAPVGTALPPNATRLMRRRVYAGETPFEEEIGPAMEIRTDARRVIEGIFEDVRLGRSIDAEGAKVLVRKTAESIIRSPDAQVWLTQLKNKDEYTSIHSMNVCILSLAFGRHLGLTEDNLNILGLGALLHDVGKVCVPLDILRKPEKLTAKEFEVMKRHPADGLLIVGETKGIHPAAKDVVFSHHERSSGSGYPRGLLSSHISLFSKVVAIVDVYDAITSNRVYHDGLDTLEATKLLYTNRYNDFDANLIEQFIQCLGVYPVGTLVELNTGEVGIVVSFRRDRRLRPKVLRILDPRKQSRRPPALVDLTQYDEKGPSAYYISKALSSGTHGVNIADYVLLIEQLVK